VLWENLTVPDFEKTCKRLVSEILAFVLLVFSASIYFVGHVAMNEMTELKPASGTCLRDAAAPYFGSYAFAVNASAATLALTHNASRDGGGAHAVCASGECSMIPLPLEPAARRLVTPTSE
jgi:hypothetical protein